MKGTILVVDDHPDNLRFLSNLLTEQGYEIRRAINGQLAINSAKSVPPDLILLDILMPDLDGYEVCKKLKSFDQTCKVPVIFLSAMDEVLDTVKAFQVGGSDYITKPVQFEEILVRIENQLTIRQLQQELEQNNIRLQQEIRERDRVESDLRQANQALQKANQALQYLADRDWLTKVANRGKFDNYLHQIWIEIAGRGLPISLIFGDLDGFKQYNDTYGHQAGDNCLKKIAQAICEIVNRPSDLVARYGGDEFALILPNTDAEEAFELAEAIRRSVQKLEISLDRSIGSDYVTLTLGVGSTFPDGDGDPDLLIQAVDKALYQAKAKGRNRTIVTRLTF